MVKQGSSFSNVVAQLEEQSSYRYGKILSLYASARNWDRHILFGEYDFPDDLTAIDFLLAIRKGKHQPGIGFTIIEGWNFRRLRREMDRNSRMKHLTTNWTDQELMSNLGAPALHPEGQFFPNTYHYRAQSSDLEVYRRAFEMMQSTLSEVWSQRSDELAIDTPYEALILASIIEKESQHLSELSMISGVFHNRLKKKMRLQTDPTVIYGLGEEFSGRLRRKHLRQNTAYNTYKIGGLPPTPISMPSLPSLIAAVNPAKTDALYFVSKRDGSHYFSKTFKEHRRAIQSFLLNKND